MISLIERYRVKKENIEEVKKEVRKFVTMVKDFEPEVLVHESYQLEDEQEFIHIVKFQNKEAKENHDETDWRKNFLDKINLLCERKIEEINLKSFY